MRKRRKSGLCSDILVSHVDECFLCFNARTCSKSGPFFNQLKEVLFGYGRQSMQVTKLLAFYPVDKATGHAFDCAQKSSFRELSSVLLDDLVAQNRFLSELSST